MARGPNYTLLPNDWGNLEYIINDLCNRIINEESSFSDYLLKDGTRALAANWNAGLFKITASQFQSVIASGTAPLIVASNTLVSNLNADLLDGNHASAFQAAGNYQPLSSNLTSLSGLSYASSAFVKMTAANTFTLDTNTYLTAEADTLATVVARGANAGATINAGAGNTLTLAAGSITDSSGAITFDNENLRTSGYFGFGSSAGALETPININYALSNSSITGINLTLKNTRNAGGTSNYGLGFNVAWQPISALTSNRNMGANRGSFGIAGLDTTYHTSSGNATIAECSGVYGGIYIIKGASHAGSATIIFGAAFNAQNPVNTTGGVITDNFAYYDQGQTAGVSNWGLGINTEANYINGKLRLGNTAVPVEVLEVVGNALIEEKLMLVQTDGNEAITSLADGYVDYLATTAHRFNNDIDISASDIITDTSTGTKFGTAASQLLGFYGATPVNQPDTIADAATQDLTGTDTVDKTKLEADLTSCKNTVNTVIDRLIELGLIA